MARCGNRSNIKFERTLTNATIRRAVAVALKHYSTARQLRGKARRRSARQIQWCGDSPHGLLALSPLNVVFKMKIIARLTLLIILLACAKSRDAQGASSSSCQPAVSASTDASERHTARGTVRSIDADKSRLWIAHEDIPGYMKAMAMPFVVSSELRRNLRPGDRIDFTFHSDGDGSLVIDTLVKRDQPSEPWF